MWRGSQTPQYLYIGEKLNSPFSVRRSILFRVNFTKLHWPQLLYIIANLKVNSIFSSRETFVYDIVPSVMTPKLTFGVFSLLPENQLPSGVELDKLACTFFLPLYLKSILVGFETSIENQFKDLAVLVAGGGFEPPRFLCGR